MSYALAQPTDNTEDKWENITSFVSNWIPILLKFSLISGELGSVVITSFEINLLTNIDGENLQYTKYSEGQYYNWHNDAGISNYYKPQYVGNSGNFDDEPNNLQTTDFLKASCELVRKLSFTLQLSDPDEYEGGNVQLIDEAGRSYIAPRQRGTIILFDSRTQHRVIKVKKGVRKSIVGWVLGPRWK